MITPQELQNTFTRLQENRWKVATSTVSQRRDKLLRLKKALQTHRAEIHQAFWEDYRKPELEVELSELFPTFEEINVALHGLKSWMKPKKVRTPLTLLGTETKIHYEAKGVVLIMSPWNYPLNLLMCPLVAAIAAGNCVMIRPSNKVPKVANVMEKIITSVFSADEVAYVQCDTKTADKILELPFDHILFTGSTRVGAMVMQAAAKNLASVTLELGGKSPTIIAPDADLDLAVERLVWAKFLNAGQTCIAPDYVFVPKNLHDQIAEKIKARMTQVYGENVNSQKQLPDFTHIVDKHSTERLQGLITESQKQGAQVLAGGKADIENRYLAPTLLAAVRPEHKVMSEEIFGPILPLLPYENIGQVISHIQNNPKPLALYLFAKNQGFIDRILKETTSGGVCINHLMVHFGNPEAPFGGVGASGQGNYHGFYGFKTFSHERTVMRQKSYSVVSWFYPPYNGKWAQRGLKLIRYLAG